MGPLVHHVAECSLTFQVGQTTYTDLEPQIQQLCPGNRMFLFLFILAKISFPGQRSYFQTCIYYLIYDGMICAISCLV